MRAQTAVQIREPYFTKAFKPVVFALALLPLALLGWGVWQDTLGANPIETITRSLGEWTLRFLLLTLLLSTLRRATGWVQGIRLRRMLGLFAFFYGVLHLLSYLWLDQFFDWAEIWYDIVERPFITVGMLAFVLMTPLALTSFKAAIRKLGRNWQRLHTLIYPLTMLGVLHFWWLADSKSRTEVPLIYAVLLAVLLGERLWRWSVPRFSKTPVTH
ncbi:sulfite oxidase heme-binding subunit YedZ [Thiothrix subterranea]|uniref:Protein-methionine-sulfoxide reductase heme-binding subunit MsrQ n=1 Tax=Thiothrix subterranea TaxID=2735563 RepID=A0AA51MU95_9GAMM|nr:protein-methionine-sulfoxide reductase heme-binding subunit MsrQ [Thiothrix subterranea]MDQ5769692.1 protein-methionine-sulfoxide reductase heme-binding subunit MsrQ [Thiothrix subterranea]WML88486.1 protein-methionine-sulfoxide reductase heme-binding subunit MsrQ [Thiothrix subterranea]